MHVREGQFQTTVIPGRIPLISPDPSFGISFWSVRKNGFDLVVITRQDGIFNLKFEAITDMGAQKANTLDPVREK